MKRRAFIAGLGGAAVWPFVAHAQQSGKVSKIGVLWPGVTFPPPPRMEAFRQALRQLGYVEGQNVAIELRYAQAGPQELPRLAADLVGLNVDVITAFGDLAPKVAQQATTTIPIVAISDDIIGAGLIEGLSRPGGNTTGFTILSPELSAKRLELLQEMVPRMSRVAAFWDPTTGRSQLGMSENAARALKLTLQIIEVTHRDDLAGAFSAARDGRSEAINVFSSPFLASLYREIVDSAAEFRLPAIYQWKEHVEAGGLMSYGPSLAGMFRQAATIVVKVLRGAKPSDLPVEQPTKLELAINLKTANALSLDISPSLLARADEVIE
jgi:putative tryptophan/tyrosine transport system substrate-binding protein